jgi:hypothetical protein
LVQRLCAANDVNCGRGIARRAVHAPLPQVG